jgi:hypothetical protein
MKVMREVWLTFYRGLFRVGITRFFIFGPIGQNRMLAGDPAAQVVVFIPGTHGCRVLLFVSTFTE